MGKKKKNKINNNNSNNENMEIKNNKQSESLQLQPTHQLQQASQNKIVQIGVQIPPSVIIGMDEYNSLKNENTELKIKLSLHESHYNKLLNAFKEKESINKELEQEIKDLREENEILRKRLSEVEKNNDQLNIKINDLINRNSVFDALSKLHDCDALSNNTFKKRYREWFKKSKYDYNIPNIGDFIMDPPSINDEEYKFWQDFCKIYPNSNNKNFRIFYEKINKDRVNLGAHHNITNITKDEFDKLLMVALPDIYSNNKKLCDEYKNWLFLF